MNFCNHFWWWQQDQHCLHHHHHQIETVGFAFTSTHNRSFQRCMSLICRLSAYLLEMVRQHCPVGFLRQMYKPLWTIYAPCEVFFCMFLCLFFLFLFCLFFCIISRVGTVYIINNNNNNNSHHRHHCCHQLHHVLSASTQTYFSVMYCIFRDYAQTASSFIDCRVQEPSIVSCQWLLQFPLILVICSIW